MAKTKTEIQKKGKGLSEKHEAFVREYLLQNNATKAYMTVYPNSSYDAARTSSSELLAKANIKVYIDELTGNLEKQLGLSKAKVVDEFMKIAFATFANLNKDWLTQKEFDDLSDREKACISEIKTETIVGDNWSKEVLKIKLHDKQRALENIAKLLGYNDQVDPGRDINIQINVINPNT